MSDAAYPPNYPDSHDPTGPPSTEELLGKSSAAQGRELSAVVADYREAMEDIRSGEYDRRRQASSAAKSPVAGEPGGAATSPGSTSAAQGRLHGKYHGLRRTSDNSEVEGWYFVIREGDEAGKAALLAYADACEDYAPELAADLRQRVRDERLMDGLYETGWER